MNFIPFGKGSPNPQDDWIVPLDTCTDISTTFC